MIRAICGSFRYGCTEVVGGGIGPPLTPGSGGLALELGIGPWTTFTWTELGGGGSCARGVDAGAGAGVLVALAAR